MKTQLLFALLLSIILSCNKKNDITPTAVPQDYRNQYLGDYYCKVEHIISGGSYYDTTFTKIIHVYNYEYNDSTIYIYGQGLMWDSVSATLFSDATFVGNSLTYPYFFYGNFIDDSIFYRQDVSSRGSYQSWTLQGKKQ